MSGVHMAIIAFWYPHVCMLRAPPRSQLPEPEPALAQLPPAAPSCSVVQGQGPSQVLLLQLHRSLLRSRWKTPPLKHPTTGRARWLGHQGAND